MDSFGSLLRKCIEDSSVSINSFSKASCLSSSFLYNIFEDKKRMPEDKFQFILNGSVFSAYNKNRLREAYYCEKYGEKEYQNVIYILNAISEQNINNQQNAEIPKLAAITDNTVFLCCNKDVVSAAQFIFDNTGNEPDAEVYTNFDYSFQEFDDAVYAKLSQKSDIRFTHFVKYSHSGSGIRNLRNLFSSLRYAGIGKNHYRYYSSDVLTELTVGLCPYFLISNNTSLLFNYNKSFGILIRNKKFSQSLSAIALSAKESLMPVVTFSRNEEEMLCELRKKPVCNILYGFGSVCLLSFADKKTLCESASPKLGAKKIILSEYLYNYYRLKDDLIYFTTTDEIENFAKTGRTLEVSDTYIDSVPIEGRIQIFKNILEKAKHGEDKLFLLNSSKLNLIKSTQFAIREDSLSVGGIIPASKNSHFIGEFMIFSGEGKLLLDFHNFKDYLINNDYILSKEYMINYFNRLIIRSPEGFQYPAEDAFQN